MKYLHHSLYKDGSISNQSIKRALKSDPHVFDEVIELTQFLPHDASPLERAFCAMNEITSVVTCQNCKGTVKFDNNRKIYGSYCSTKCCNSDPSKKERMVQTNIKKYGYPVPTQSSIIQQKIIQTNIKRYGVDHIFQSDEHREKARKTNIEKYGVDNPLKSEKIRENRLETIIERYGVPHYSQTSEFKEKTRKTNIEKYGVGCVFELDHVREKAYDTRRCNGDFESLNRRDWLSNAYSSESITDIASNLSVSSTTVYNYLVEHGINIKPHHLRKNNPDVYNILNDYEELRELYKGKSVHLLKEELGVSFSHLNKKLIECGAKLNRGTSSSYEDEIASYIESVSGYSMIRNTRKLISPKEIDIYIPEKNLAIEFDGLYWHSSLDDSLRTAHLDKTNACENNGIQLLHIFEDEWNNKKDIWKSVISSKLGKSTRIYARKCEIEEVPGATAKKFFDENHLQGSITHGTNLGLYYEGNLVSCLSYGNSRFEANTTELYRYASKLRLTVVGGFSKLLKGVPKPVVSYANRRWSDGNLYKMNGFKLVHVTPPNYFYISNSQLYSRMKFQKHKLKGMPFYDDSLSESQIMALNGYRKIYDCGNLKYILDK